MGRLLKTIVFLLVLGILAFVGYAYIGDLSPEVVEVNQPVTLNVE